MQTWKWLYDPAAAFNWRFIFSVAIRVVILFVIVNVVFALVDPLPALGSISAYNHLFRGRERLPYGENAAVSYNLSLNQIDAMFESHVVASRKDDDEFRVVLIGDSAVWGVLLEPDDTLAGQINRLDYHTADGQTVQAYNLGYPIWSLTKDLLLLDYALDYDPDLVVWLFTLGSFGQAAQMRSPLVQHNPDPVEDLIKRFDVNQDPNDPRFVRLSFWDKLFIRRRRDLADLMRLQLYGVPWAVTGIDQEYPDYEPRLIDLPADDTWEDYTPQTLTTDDLALDVIRAGVDLVGDTPIVLINEPMFLSDGENSDIRYNSFFPRWAYDEYRRLLDDYSARYGWFYLDLWDGIPEADCYTDSAVHLTPECSARLGKLVGAAIVELADQAGRQDND